MKIHFILSLLLSAAVSSRAEHRVPGFTAYLEPEVEGAEVSAPEGVTGWTNPTNKVVWFGELKHSGKLDCSVVVHLPPGAESRLRLSVNNTRFEASVTGSEKAVPVRFGTVEIGTAGYQKFTLESLNPPGTPAGDIEALVLDGTAAQDAHFNLKPHRNAASVHLAYVLPVEATNVEAFYCEITAVEDPVWTFYMACGWHRGYFGMQVNSSTERQIIFSVWDSGDEAIDRDKVAAENRVSLVAKGDGVYARDFGNEGTGGHSHLKYQWKTGEKQRFIVTAKPTDATHTVFSGFYFRPDTKRWMLISSWKAPKEGGYLRGLHSFSENFGGANGHLLRKALYGNQWIRTTEGRWVEVTTASFSHDDTGKADRLDRYMGVESGRFFLSHGGFVPGFTKFGEQFTRRATTYPPSDITLPPVGEK